MYTYSSEKMKKASYATFSIGKPNHLKTIHGFSVFSYVTFTSKILKYLQNYPFSTSFLKAYPNFAFQVSDFQASIIYPSLSVNRLSIQFKYKAHQQEFVEAVKSDTYLFPSFGWSNIYMVVSFDKNCFSPVNKLESILTPTQTLL